MHWSLLSTFTDGYYRFRQLYCVLLLCVYAICGLLGIAVSRVNDAQSDGRQLVLLLDFRLSGLRACLLTSELMLNGSVH